MLCSVAYSCELSGDLRVNNLSFYLVTWTFKSFVEFYRMLCGNSVFLTVKNQNHLWRQSFFCYEMMRIRQALKSQILLWMFDRCLFRQFVRCSFVFLLVGIVIDFYRLAVTVFVPAANVHVAHKLCGFSSFFCLSQYVSIYSVRSSNDLGGFKGGSNPISFMQPFHHSLSCCFPLTFIWN